MRKAVWVTAAAGAAAAVVAAITGTALAGTQGSDPAVISDSSMHANFTTMGGADVLPTERTVAHWHGTTLNPSDGITYGYNMVGADPNNCGSACSSTVPTDIYPLIVNVGGMTFDGTRVVQPVLNSPQFANNDYTSTTRASTDQTVANPPGYNAGGALSAGNTSNQLEDATMRSQFNQTGSSPYHVILGTPVVHDPITINVPQNHGVLLQSGRHVIFADVNLTWWASQLQNILNSTHADPTHLPILLTDNVMLYEGTDVFNCCVIGFHGAAKVPGNGGGQTGSNGNAVVQTYAWASWVVPGVFNPVTAWALQDIQALSHEIAEWGDDPFINNTVQPWVTPTAPQYGCSGFLETGDPVVAIGFSMGTNTTDQGPAPNGQQVADGTYHPEDEVFLPWFMRTSPNTISQATQSPSANIGRYTLMGDLNPYAGFRQPATGC